MADAQNIFDSFGAPPGIDGLAVMGDMPTLKKRLVDTGAEVGGSSEGLEVVNLTGKWVLDVVRSDRMDSFFSTMGLTSTAIEAAAKAEQEHETIHEINQTADTYKIHRRSRMIDATKTYKIGQETQEPFKDPKGANKTYTNKVLVTADANCVRTVTSMPAGIRGQAMAQGDVRREIQLIDTRRLVDGGAVMTFSIELLTPQGTVSLMRYFDRQQPKPASLLVDVAGEEVPPLDVTTISQ